MPTNTDQGQSFVDWHNSLGCNDDYNCEGDIYVVATIGFWSDFTTPWIEEAQTAIKSFLNLSDDVFDVGMTLPLSRFASVRQNDVVNTLVDKFEDTETFAAINETVTMNLGGQVVGFDMKINFDLFMSNGNIVNKIAYSSSNATDQPIIKLADNVTSWNVGDTIVIGSTDFNQDHTETFKLIECGNDCSDFEVTEVDNASVDPSFCLGQVESGTDLQSLGSHRHTYRR